MLLSKLRLSTLITAVVALALLAVAIDWNAQPGVAEADEHIAQPVQPTAASNGGVMTVSWGCPASTIFAGWRQSVLPVHLLGVAPLLGSVGAVAGDVKLQDDGVMDHPVDCRGGGHGVGEDAFPLREDQV